MCGDGDRGGAFSAAARWPIVRHRESTKVKLPIDVIGLVLLVVFSGINVIFPH